MDTATDGTENPGPNAGTANADWPDLTVPGYDLVYYGGYELLKRCRILANRTSMSSCSLTGCLVGMYKKRPVIVLISLELVVKTARVLPFVWKR